MSFRTLAAMVLFLAPVAAAEAQIPLNGQSVPLASLGPEPGPVDPSLTTFRLRADGPARPAASLPAVSAGGKQDVDAFDALIGEHAQLNALRPELVRAVVRAESDFNPNARSPKGALGLMQLMPATARQFGVLNPFDPEDNVRAGTAYLRQLLNRYENDEKLALAAYNAGPGAVDRHGQRVPPYRETQDYVARVTAAAHAADAPPAVAGRIVKLTETVDGREVVTYTNRRTR